MKIRIRISNNKGQYKLPIQAWSDGLNEDELNPETNSKEFVLEADGVKILSFFLLTLASAV